MTHDGREWWKFWEDTFILDLRYPGSTFNHILHEEWLDVLSRLIVPCDPSWPMVYIRRYPVANDN